MPRSTVTIEELTGRKRTLQLRGGGLPSKGAQFPVKQRLSTTWLPGSGEATQQIVGFAEGDPEWDGYWSTPTLAGEPCLLQEGGGAIQRIARAWTLSDVVESLVQAGALLRVTWRQDEDTIKAREGRIEEFTPAPQTKDDIAWHVKWAWSGRGSKTSRVVRLKKDSQLAQHKRIESELTKLEGELLASKIVSSASAIPGSATSFSLGQVEGFLRGIKDFTSAFARQVQLFGSRIREIGDLAQSVESLPAEVAQQFVDAAATVQSACVAFSDAVTRRGPETWVRLDESASLVAQVHASGYLGSAKAAADACALACAEAREALFRTGTLSAGSQGGQGRAHPDAVSFAVARQGDTFASVARRRLGDSSLGPAVAKASGYSWLDVEPLPGALLVIPSAKAAAALMPGI